MTFVHYKLQLCNILQEYNHIHDIGWPLTWKTWKSGKSNGKVIFVKKSKKIHGKL